MNQDISNIHFKKRSNPALKFEILSLNDLFRRDVEVPLTKPQRVRFYILIFITKGYGRHFIDFEAYDYEPGSLLFISQNRIQFFEPNLENDGFMILFTEDFLYKSEADAARLRKSPFLDYQYYTPKLSLGGEDKDAFERMIQEMRVEYQRPFDDVQEEILRSLLNVLLLRAERLIIDSDVYPRIPADVQKFLQLVDENYSNYHHVRDYMPFLETSTKTLNKRTQSALGKTAKECIDARIILEAKRLLTHTSLAVKALAHQLGFSEPTNFIKFFRQHTQRSPKRFRESHQ